MKTSWELNTAIESYEHLTRLRITIHDFTFQLWQYLEPERFKHNHPRCQLVKSGPRGHLCVKFEVDNFRAHAHLWRSGRFHRCHAGYSEIALPVYQGDLLLFILFAGPCFTEDASILDLDHQRNLPEDVQDLKAFTSVEIEHYKEHLRQLAARIRLLIEEAEPVAGRGLSRKVQIQKWIQDQFAGEPSISALAGELHLSPERTRHAIKELFGISYNDLLLETRMKAASNLLLNTTLSISEIGTACGFSDSSSFTRAFRRYRNESPLNWRRINQG